MTHTGRIAQLEEAVRSLSLMIVEISHEEWCGSNCPGVEAHTLRQELCQEYGVSPDTTDSKERQMKTYTVKTYESDFTIEAEQFTVDSRGAAMFYVAGCDPVLVAAFSSYVAVVEGAIATSPTSCPDTSSAPF